MAKLEIKPPKQPDDEVKARSIKLCRDNGWDPRDPIKLTLAGIEVIKADAELGERYREQCTLRERGEL